ncbi:MAG: tRNA 2-thiouridine(34) synthase MnmA [Acidobacteriota bacterium]
MHVALLLSGGVDSSVALRLLLEAGHQVTAFYLKIWLEDELEHLGECPWEDDLSYARAVCQDVGVPLEVIPLQREYHQRVVSWAIDELRSGRTPSPDILCNQHIKFGAFIDALKGRPFDRVASGHYARLRSANGEDDPSVELLRGVDPVKDQTYFLFQLDQLQLRRCLFPLGAYHKRDVRQLAQDFELPNRQRPDSQGICFLGKIRYDDFVQSYLGERPGEIRDVETGRRLGEHRGFWFHTIGQRRGLGLGGGPWYVVTKDTVSNVVYVSHRKILERHQRAKFQLEAPHWINGRPEESARPLPLQVKIRHSPQTSPCRVHWRDDGLEIELEAPDPGVAPGQVAVLYRDQLCLGGGMISVDPRVEAS